MSRCAPRTLARERRYVPPPASEARAQVAEQTSADHLVRMEEVINKKDARRRHGTEMLEIRSKKRGKRSAARLCARRTRYHVRA